MNKLFENLTRKMVSKCSLIQLHISSSEDRKKQSDQIIIIIIILVINSSPAMNIIRFNNNDKNMFRNFFNDTISEFNHYLIA